MKHLTPIAILIGTVAICLTLKLSADRVVKAVCDVGTAVKVYAPGPAS